MTMVGNVQRVPKISKDYIVECESSCAEGSDEQLRELSFRYGASQEDIINLIGKTEEETQGNINNYKNMHKLIVSHGIDNEETRSRYNARYGYKRIYDEDSGTTKLIEHKEEQEVIKIIMKLINSHNTYSNIMRYLQSNNIKTRSGKSWSVGLINRIVKYEERKEKGEAEENETPEN